eukprot:gene29091-35111_t
MLVLLSLLVLFCCHSLQGQTVENVEEVGRNLTFLISHSLDGAVSFQPRSIIKLIPRGEGRYALTVEGKNTVREEDVASFKSLLSKNDLYLIKVRMEGGDDETMASLPACDLMRSGFKEDIQVYLNSEATSLSAISYSSPPIPIPNPCEPARIKDQVSFQTRIRMGEETKVPPLPLQLGGPRPPYLKDVRLGLEEEKKGAQAQANQPFLYKYWYVVLGLVLYLLLGGAGEAPRKGEAAGSAQAARPKTD